MSKQKVLKHLEPYRDKTLSFGCRIKLDTTGKETTYVCNSNETFWIKSDETERPTELSRWGTGYFIIGHPLTHADLLRALKDTACWSQWRMTLMDGCYQLNYHEAKVAERGRLTRNIIIPLTYRTVEDIPEDHAMWGQLLEVINIK